MATITNTDFATEVKSDRLKVLHQATLVIAAVILFGLITFGISSYLPSQVALMGGISLLIVILACLATGYVLRRGNLEPATWIYGMGGILAITFLLTQDNETVHQTIPYIAPILVFIIGVLLSPASTILFAIISSILVLFAPSVGQASINIEIHQTFAVILILFSAAMATQIAGELYQVTQWALQNYQRERKTNDELFEKRHELQRSLKRSEVLSENLQETNKELESATRAAEDAKNFRGQFLANMSHELRTPLNAIIGFSETMLQFPVMYDDETLPPAYERDLSQIYSSGRQLLHVINDILDLAKVDAGKLELHLSGVDAVPLINAAMSTTKGLIGKKSIMLERNVPDDLPKVWADETRLRQVLLNIYSNAAKYTDEGVIKVTARVIGDEVEIAIKDTGIGIDPEYHGKLFQEFQQAKAGGRDARSGSGLGLAISRQLLELMGGRIWMESEVGKGSTFFFTVKVYDPQAENPPTMTLQMEN
jgi:signal transduction histidine kinase